MLVCKKGSWEPRWSYSEDLVFRGQQDEGFPVNYVPYRQIGLGLDAPAEEWEGLQHQLGDLEKSLELD